MANQETVQLNFDESTTAGIEGGELLGIELARLFRAIYEDLAAKEVQEDKQHGVISAEDNSTATEVLSGGAWYQITIFDTDGHSIGVVPDHTNDHLTIGRKGHYFIGCSITVLSDTGTGFEVEAEIYKNDGFAALVDLHAHRTLAGGGGDVGAMTLIGCAALDVGDTIELWMRNKNNTTDFIVQDVTLTALEL